MIRDCGCLSIIAAFFLLFFDYQNQTEGGFLAEFPHGFFTIAKMLINNRKNYQRISGRKICLELARAL